MMRNYFIFTIITLLLISIIGCSTKFIDYKAKTTDEEEIKTTLLNYWEAEENADRGFLSFFHEDARIMTGRYRAVVSKQQYSIMLQSIFAQGWSWEKGSPKMNVKGDEAIIKVWLYGGGVSLYYTYNLVRENGRWYIMSTKY